MRLWSLHPKYLDTKGLLALWRESLLAKHVLESKTKGYKNHPQLDRFKKQKDPILAIHSYLFFIYEEAKSREFSFDPTKFKRPSKKISMVVNKDQIDFEWQHLLSKLKKRSPKNYASIANCNKIQAHPQFKIKKGPIEKWEIIK